MSDSAETASGDREPSGPPSADGRTHTDAVVVCQPIDEGRVDELRDRLATARPTETDGPDWLLAGDDVVTVSLFLDRRDRAAPALCWYVEVTDGDAWQDPHATLTARSPLIADLEALFVGTPHSFGPDAALVHATNPRRPATPDPVDVVLVRVDVTPGLGTGLLRLIAWLIDRLEGTWIGRRLESSSDDVLDDEGMWTETLYIDDSDAESGIGILWFMEAADMDQVTEAYAASENRVARLSEKVLSAMVVQPTALFRDPMGLSRFERLAHETSAARR